MTAISGISTSALAATLCFATMVPVGAMAQTPTPDRQDPATPSDVDQANAGIGDIIVTAQRRSESLQKTSVILNVVGSEQIARAGITQVQDLMKALPGVQISTVGPGPQIYIRGVGDFGSTAVSNPAVAFNIDGVYVGRTASIASEFYDIDRVEVLKGPQGTLYGRNASGGAVNIITRRPRLGEVEGNFDVELGNFDSATLSGGVNLPLGDTLAVRASGTYVRKDGYTVGGNGDDQHEAGRVKLLWEPSADVSLILSGSYGHVGGRGAAFVLLNPYPGNGPWVDAASPAGRAFQADFIARQGLAGVVSPAPSVDLSFQDQRFWNISGQLDWQLGDITLTVLPAHRDSKIRNAQIHTFPYIVGAGAGDIPARPETSEQTSLEVRLSSESDSLKWVVGGYFYNEDQETQYTVNFGLLQNQLLNSSLKTRSYSAFGQATWSVADALRLIGGLRYTSDRRALEEGRKFSVSPAFAGGCLPPNPAQTCLLESYEGRKTFQNVSWKAGIEYDLSPQNLIFATASSGFKAGGFNEQLEVGATGNSGLAAGYQPEKLFAYELGIKNRFLDDRLQLNFEGFYWKYKNHQEGVVAFSPAGNTNFSFVNAGDARMYGGSVELIAKPWRGGTFNGSVEYNNTKYQSFDIRTPIAFVQPGVSTSCAVTLTNVVTPVGPLANVDCSGNELTRAPKWTGSVGFTQVFDLPSSGAVEVGTDASFASARWLSTDFIPIERADGYVLLNASIRYTAPEDRFYIAAFARNVTNEKVYTGGFIAPFLAPLVNATIQPPRTYGVRFGVKF